MSKARVIVSAVILEGRSKAEVARDYGVARSWVHVLVDRYLEGGWPAIEPRPRTPKSNPRRISPALEAEIVQLRRSLTRHGHDAGAHTIAAHLERRHGTTPAVSTIWKALKRHGLVAEQQRRRPVPERLVRQPTGHRVPRHALRPAPPTPQVVLDHAALKHRPIRLEVLPDSLEAELVETAEHGQIGRGEGSVGHVEVFQMGGLGTRPRPLPGHRHAHPDYTLKCEEPPYRIGKHPARLIDIPWKPQDAAMTIAASRLG